MYATTQKSVFDRTLIYFVCVVILAILAAVVFAMPKHAAPPLGTWAGQFEDKTEVTLTLTEDAGFYLDGTSIVPIVGTWTWIPISPVAGILNVEPSNWPDRVIAYSVTWLGPGRIELSNRHFTVVLRRMV